MANFDSAAGITQDETTKLLGDYFSQAPADNSPFKGEKTENIEGLGSVTVNWNIEAAPSISFAPPTQASWDSALNASGQTNQAAHTPLPSLPTIQVMIPTLTAFYTVGTAEPVGGTSHNLVAYATLTFGPGAITHALVALTIDEANFSTWDKVIFNRMLLPKIFESANQILSVIHVPALDWEGVALNPVQFQLQGNQLIAAATLTGNQAALDVSGVTWPTDKVFVLASQTLLNAALSVFAKQGQDKPFGDSGDFQGLADWQYSGKVTSLTATVKTFGPLTINAQLSVSLNAGATLTAAGMALAAAGCVLGTAVLAMMI